jgi:parvulin-like peptidyl-prolyl isomerase
MAEEALVRLRAGEEFDALARKMSTHSSRTRGGDLGWVAWGSLDPATEKAALGTAPGQAAGPFAVGEGFRLLRVIEERKGEPPAFEKVSERLRAILRSRREMTLREDLLASIRGSHPPREDAAAVSRLLAAPAEGGAAPDPPDAAILMTTASGLPVTAGRVRERAKRSGLRPAEAWRLAASDALLVDEARRRITPDAAMEHKVRLFADGRVREEVERDVILRKLTISDAEVEAFYDKDPAAFETPPAFRLRHILLATQAEAEEVRRALAGGADFAALARQESRHAASAAGGGDLGWVDSPPGGADEAAARAIFSLQPGQVSGVIESKEGFSVVQLLEKRGGETPAFEKVREEAARRLVVARQKELRDAFVGRLKGHADIRIFEDKVRRAIKLQDEVAATHLRPAAAPASPGGH